MTKETPIVIRPLRETDWPAIEAITKRIWTIGLDYVREQTYGGPVGGKPWHAHKLESMRRAAAAQPADWYVTEVDGRMVGFCSLHADTKTGIGHVGVNGLAPEAQGKGYGSRQLAFVLDELRRRGMRVAEVITGLDEGHSPARKLYERAGFTPLSESRTYMKML